MSPRGEPRGTAAPATRKSDRFLTLEERDQERMIANKDGGVHGRTAALFARLAQPGRDHLAADGLGRAQGSAQRWLLEAQHADGYWVGELEGDTILESEYILMMAFLGREREDVCAKLARYVYEQECPGGGWSNYPGGPAAVSASVEAYCALKVIGVPADDPVMTRARRVILDGGGVRASIRAKWDNRIGRRATELGVSRRGRPPREEAPYARPPRAGPCPAGHARQ